MKDPISGCYEQLMQLEQRTYELILERFYLAVLKPGDWAIDVGAHKGRHTFPMAQAVAPSGGVFAFEPIPHLFEQLKLDATDMPDVSINVSSIALSKEKKSEVDFVYLEDRPGLSGLMIRQAHKDLQVSRIKVETDLLDSLIPKNKVIKFIKIDAEGADFSILQGARRLLAVSRPLVVFESGMINANPAQSYGYTEKQFNDFFAEVNYSLYDIAGFRYQTRFWDKRTLNDFVAIPAEKESVYREILLAVALTEFTFHRVNPSNGGKGTRQRVSLRATWKAAIARAKSLWSTLHRRSREGD